MTRSPKALPLAAVFALAVQLACQTQPDHPGRVYWGSNRYIEYVVGNAPLVISMPHGGYLKPPTLRSRTYGVTTQDGRTQETGQEIARKLRQSYGLHPHLIINLLHRVKLDANREIVEAAQGDKAAEQAWRDYHDFIDRARRAVVAEYGKGLYVDLHGHSHSQNWIEFGYLLSSDDLNLSNSKLNQSYYVNKSSLRSLASSTTTVPFTEILRGKSSFGGLLEAKGFDTVPGPKNPGPGTNSYFSGGYNTARWGSRNGGTVDGLQIELPSILRRDLKNRDSFTTALAQSFRSFLLTYHKIDLAAGARLTIEATAAVATEAGEPAEFTISRSGSTGQLLLVPVLVAGSASAGLDYTKLLLPVLIPAGQKSRTVQIQPLQDNLVEGQETVTVTLLPGQSPGYPKIGDPNTATLVLQDDEPDPNLFGHWPFDETSGNLALDRSGGNRSGTLLPLGSGPRRINGPLSGALAFDEVDDRVVIPDFDYAARGQLTLSFWFRAPSSSQAYTQYFFSHGNVNKANSLNVYWFESTGLLRTRLRCKTDITSSNLLDVETNFMDNQWHFYTLAVEKGFGYASVYIDGKPKARNQLGGDSLDPAGDIHIGGRQGLSSTRFLKGEMDDLMLQGLHLSAAEVEEFHRASQGYTESYGAGCPTSASTVAIHSASGRVGLGGTVVYSTSAAAPASSGILYFGASRSIYLGSPLPLDLTFLGAPGCWLHQDLLVAVGFGIASGGGWVPVTLPKNLGLRGLRVYSQVMVRDQNANSAGFAVSNALLSAIGG